MKKTCKLILIEGLTGAGKSVLAHFIARQLMHQGKKADWLHEGELEHPLLAEGDQDMASFRRQTLEKWQIFAAKMQQSREIIVAEACYFNNLVEVLMAENIEKETIFQFMRRLQAVIAPLNPALIYLTQPNTAEALARNFRNRGDKFKQFVIDYTTGTSYAKRKGYAGDTGMRRFWEDFASLTDQVYDRFPRQRIKLDVSSGKWEEISKHILAFLQIPQTLEPGPDPACARALTGIYAEQGGDRKFAVTASEEGLYINFFHTVRTRLVPKTSSHFIAAGWHFEVAFTELTTGARQLTFLGRDIDYLRLAGVTAVKPGIEAE